MKTRLKKPFLIREKPNPDRDKKLRTSGNEPEVFYLVLTVLSSKLNAKSMGMSIHYSGCIREKEMLDPLIEEVADICRLSGRTQQIKKYLCFLFKLTLLFQLPFM